MPDKFSRELRALQLHVQPAVAATATVGDADLADLPQAVQRYMRFMGVVGKPRLWSFRAGFSGRFRTSATGAWRGCKIIQYDSRDELARVFHMALRFGPVPVLARDTYLRGHGRMLGRAFDLVTVVDGSGPELDIGELVTYLNDGILFAPSMLLGQAAWTAVDDRSFDVALTDHGTTVTARVLLDEQGAPADFSTDDRFMGDPERRGRFVRTRWTTPVESWTTVDGRRVPTSARAIWHTPSGPFAYADFRLLPETLAFNVAPGE